ncbi:DUF397 domain-containing protein [Streptomyces ureilyticus]|uniref:DUF397 domain-containing protein n=1 Tax=Streptomyces ureilyticus TaxID=1775131 RepID=A0ABX0E329_9ACTN|nr:DUF397 domain-containing protein [Streptomyces ureilyticus]NGO48626.1 DUF397 domain-containing protein [Streptomyces ureilyticus]
MSAPIQWQKSTFSGGGSSEDCIELAATNIAIHLRESDHPAALLTTSPTPLHALLSTLKSGRLASR